MSAGSGSGSGDPKLPLPAELNRETPNACPACGEPFTHAIPPDVDPHERDEAGALQAAAAPKAPVQAQHKIGKSKGDWAGWEFYHTQQDGGDGQ